MSSGDEIKQGGKEQHSIGMHNSKGGYYARFRAPRFVKTRAPQNSNLLPGGLAGTMTKT